VAIGTHDKVLFFNDEDNDGYWGRIDVFPNDPSEWFDTDQDGKGNNADDDDDGDGVVDGEDAFPLDEEEWIDTDSDGIGDNGDTDDDGDGYEDSLDAFPLDKNDWNDTDLDGVGNNTDAFPLDPAASLDSDGDGYPDEWNQNMTEANSTTGLRIDLYPEDPNRWEKEDDDSPAYPLTMGLASVAVVAALKRRKYYYPNPLLLRNTPLPPIVDRLQ